MTDISAGLIITLIGMGLVFLALILLWGLMYLMVLFANRIFPDREEGGAGEDNDPGDEVLPLEGAGLTENEMHLKSAAAAVAVGLALKTGANAVAALALGSPAQSASSWQAVHRANRLTQRLNLFSRKTGRN
ncbi:MAG TPA: OadG family protein [Longilinea sp.]|nr:OadG family protein [Longilinea sp.]